MFVLSLMQGMPTIFRQDLDCRSLRDEICFASVVRKFFTYFLISCKSEDEETLLVVIMIPLSLAQMKSAIVFDKIFLRAQFILITYMLESLRNLFASLLFISTITYLYEGLFVVMLILGSGLPLSLFMTFWTILIFLLGKFGNISLIFNISIATLDDEIDLASLN